MSMKEELLSYVNRYLASEISFEELFEWTYDHEDELLLAGPDSVGGQLASAISLVAWEVREGYRPPEAIQEAIAEDLNAILGAGARL